MNRRPMVASLCPGLLYISNQLLAALRMNEYLFIILS
jgi:hypothetical protein